VGPILDLRLPLRLRRVVREPRAVVWGRRDPARLFAQYGRLARQAGFEELHLVLSFDCDTLADAEVACEVHDRLLQLGVLASYAVPGEILERGADAYRQIAKTGAEFLNHGYREHTVKEGDHYRSTLFYDRLTPAEVREDVVAGDRAVAEIVGRRPSGFRVPHFGTFQRPRQLRLLHGILAGLGYAYSSSTVPLWGFRRGPAFRDFGVLEFPLSGMATAPLQILDSWAFFAAPDRVREIADYGREGAGVAELYRQAGAGVLSFYADPSQVHRHDVFFETVARWREIARPSTYEALSRALEAPGVGETSSRTTSAI
jgi:hypothetical protein